MPARASFIIGTAMICLAGCVHRPAVVAPAAPAAQSEPPVQSVQPVEPVPPVMEQPAPTAENAAPPAVTVPPPASSPAPPPSAAKNKVSSPRNSARTATSAVPVAAAPAPAPTAAPVPAPTSAPSEPRASTQPTLDLNSLEQRLRDTHAIGVFTKLSLKNQVDDLLKSLRAFHGGAPKPPLEALRESYELLLLKVVTLLQSGDPQLAATVSSSRDALWALLADPKKFAQITFSPQEPLCGGADCFYT